MSSDTGGEEPPIRRSWSATTKVVIAVAVLVLLALAVYRFSIVFIPLIIGAVTAYILIPLVRLISRRLRIPRGVATALIYLVLLAVLIPLPALLIPWAVRQLGTLQQNLIEFIAYLDTISADTVEIIGFEIIVGDLVNEITGALADLVRSAIPDSLGLVFDVAEIVLLVVFTVLVGFYVTRDSEKFLDWFRGLAPPGYRADIQKLLAEIDHIWSAFFRGQVLLVVVASVLLTGISAALGLPQPVLMGVLGGLLEFLPSVGHAIWLVTASILALVVGSSTLPVSNGVFVAIVIGVHLLYTQFDLNFLIPRIIGRQVHLHPMVVIIGIIIGAQIGGVLGVLLAAPTIASLRVLGRYTYARLFDLEPFPMVGPPAAPPQERERQAEALAAQTAPPLPDLRPALERLRRRRPPADDRDPET